MMRDGNVITMMRGGDAELWAGRGLRDRGRGGDPGPRAVQSGGGVGQGCRVEGRVMMWGCDLGWWCGAGMQD